MSTINRSFHLFHFQIAMRMYTLADKAISQEEFSRAVTVGFCVCIYLNKLFNFDFCHQNNFWKAMKTFIHCRFVLDVT